MTITPSECNYSGRASRAAQFYFGTVELFQFDLPEQNYLLNSCDLVQFWNIVFLPSEVFQNHHEHRLPAVFIVRVIGVKRNIRHRLLMLTFCSFRYLRSIHAKNLAQCRSSPSLWHAPSVFHSLPGPGSTKRVEQRRCTWALPLVHVALRFQISRGKRGNSFQSNPSRGGRFAAKPAVLEHGEPRRRPGADCFYDALECRISSASMPSDLG